MSSSHIVCCALWTSVISVLLILCKFKEKTVIFLDLNNEYVKWLYNEQTRRQLLLLLFFEKATFVVKSCFLYTKLDCHND